MFKIGDKVEILFGFAEGMKGTIKHVDNSALPYFVSFNTSSGLWVDGTKIKKVEEEPIFRGETGIYMHGGIKGEKEMTKLQLEHSMNSEIRSLEGNIEIHLEVIEDLDIKIKELQEGKKNQRNCIKRHESRIETIHNNLDKLNSKNFVFGKRVGNNYEDELSNEYFLLEDDTLIDVKGNKYSYSIIDSMVLIFNEEKKGK